MIAYRTRCLGRKALLSLIAVALLAVVVCPAAATARITRADASLARAVDRYSAHLGIRRHWRSQIEAAELPPTVVRSVSRVLRQLYRCDLITRSHTNQLLAALPGVATCRWGCRWASRRCRRSRSR